MLIQYTSNNSGGSWWLKDKDWYALEKRGWKVSWVKDEKGKFFRPDKDGRFLGALAKYAQKDFPSVGDALREFEEITGKEVSDEGCNCCGAPHAFNWGCAIMGKKCKCPPKSPHKNYGYASGEDCLDYLYSKERPGSLREATETIRKLKEKP